jgi:DNA-directed RNA polymerase subunit beta'
MIDTVYRALRPEGHGHLLRPASCSLASAMPASAGISFGKDDMVIPDTKAKIVGDETRCHGRGIRAAVQ